MCVRWEGLILSEFLWRLNWQLLCASPVELQKIVSGFATPPLAAAVVPGRWASKLSYKWGDMVDRCWLLHTNFHPNIPWVLRSLGCWIISKKSGIWLRLSLLAPRLFFFSLDAGGSNPANVMPGDFFGIFWPKIQRLLFLNWSIGNHGNANLEITNNTNSLANMSNALVNGHCYLTNPGETPRWSGWHGSKSSGLSTSCSFSKGTSGGHSNMSWSSSCQNVSGGRCPREGTKTWRASEEHYCRSN